MLASAPALAHAADGIFHGSLLSERARQQMTRFIATRSSAVPEYGLGLARLELGGEQVWAHDGDHVGFHADLAFLPDQRVTIVALENLQAQQPGQNVLVDRLIAEVSETLHNR